MSSTVASTVYLRVKTTESRKNRLLIAFVKFCGKLMPWSPPSRGQLEPDILNTSRSGSTKSSRTKRAVGRAYSQPVRPERPER